MVGMELEDNGIYGNSASTGSHWEARTSVWPLMGAQIYPGSPLTVFTLALLYDSGWYNVNWEYEFTPPYGYTYI